MKRIAYLLLGALTLSGCRSHTMKTFLADEGRRDRAELMIQPTADSVLAGRRHEMVPTVAVSGDGGVLFLAWYTGGPGEGPGNFVTVAVSTDNGESWSEDELVVYPKEPSTRFFDPVLWKDGNDQVWLFYIVSVGGLHWDGLGGVNALPIEWDGEKILCGEPQLLSYGIMMNKPIELSQRDLTLYPVSVWPKWHLTEADLERHGSIPDGTFVYAHRTGTVGPLDEYSSIATLPYTARSCDEHMIVEVGEGDLLCLVRGKRMTYFSRSDDYGESWSRLQPFTSAGPTTGSRFHISKLASGNLVLVMNNSTERREMTMLLSEDGGMSWPYRMVVEPRDTVSYPDLAQAPDGTIHLTYDRNRNSDREIWYCRLTEEEIKKGDATGVFRLNVNEEPLREP